MPLLYLLVPSIFSPINSNLSFSKKLLTHIIIQL
nr:MAG TPA: hypothetical protein [Caudoviricetes sp.]